MGLALQKMGQGAIARKGIALAVPKGRQRQSLRERFATGSVEWSPDLQRILALPKRDKPDMEPFVRGLTELLRTPNGKQTLREMQAWVISEAPVSNGIVVAAMPGAGKTLLGMLLPMVWPYVRQADGTMRPPRAVLMIPPDLRVQFAADWKRYGEHWKLPNLAGSDSFVPGRPVLHVIAYSELQQPKNSALLEQLQPDLFMGDEISALKNFESARTIRVRRFFAKFYEAAFCGWDATITSDGLEDFWHFFAWALAENSPVPLEQGEVRRWARAIDPEKYNDGYFLPGELNRFCEPGEDVRSGLQRRLVQTKGFVTTEDQRLGIPLIFRERRVPEIPAQVLECLKNLRRPHQQGGWRRPDGEEFTEAPEVYACARQLASGFFMRWRYPKGEPPELIDEWFLKRQSWNRELRAQLQNPSVHLDSKQLCRNAAERWFDGGCTGCDRGPLLDHSESCREYEAHPLWRSETLLPWRDIEDKVAHESETVWLSDWLLQDAAAWAKEAPGIVWVEHPEFGHRLAKMSGLVYYGGGDDSAAELDAKYGDGAPVSDHSIICSVKANLKGKNLQGAFHRNLITAFPASNSFVEQLVGRTYRPGQRADHVLVDYYLHTKELENALEKAKERAAYVHEFVGTVQKLVYAQWEKAA